MGNIEMVDNKRKPIFHHKSPLFKSTLLPHNNRLYLPPQTIKSVIKNTPKTDRSYSPLPPKR